ncbi:energy transducer TonB [Polynucleobacter brandtiae]|uniref:TonB family protein n=1 Tax=Polynucleobacter brandtiae TaxID=1938816 RepID=A0A2M8VQS5_9BURK|nr:energy transducer TonB [Polynucleobacter brandtiae]PJI79524.1 TonB family protein [Polynucleobacter brandtiae]
MAFFNRLIQSPRSAFKTALAISISLHIGLLILYLPPKSKTPNKIEQTVVVIKLEQPEPPQQKTTPVPTVRTVRTLTNTVPATQAAPSAPTAQEWAFASQYTLKNSKGYRHSWGKQVRSMMGTAVEGPDQGEVRFRIEIAPNGQLVSIDTLWSTSRVAEKLARDAVSKMPALPPTPNGKPLVFERTISFSPFASDDTPLYRDDCIPDPPQFINPFAWDGKSAQTVAKTKPPEKLDPQALAECLKQLPQDSIEGEAASNQRQIEQWRSSKPNLQK